MAEHKGWQQVAAARQLLQASPTPSPSPTPTSTAPSPPAGAAPPPSSTKNFVVGAAVGIAFGVFIVAAAFGAFLFWRWRKRQQRKAAQAQFASNVPLHSHPDIDSVAPTMILIDPSKLDPSQVEPPVSGKSVGPHEVLPQVQPASNQSLSTTHSNGAAEPFLPAPMPQQWSNGAPPPPHSAASAPARSKLQLTGMSSGGVDAKELPERSRSEMPPGHGQETQGSTQSSVRPREQPRSGGIKGSDKKVVGYRELQQLTGLEPGDPFLRNVAPAFKWCLQPLEKLIPVEEGVNAATAASSTVMKQWLVPGTNPGPAPVKLTSQQVQDEIELLALGLIDRGGTAVVFKCKWPKHFGPNHMLAVKVMNNPGAGYDTAREMSSFRHEADVLTRCSHRNIVRLYGYCLEPPNVCLIMELLPSSLKTRLYGTGVSKAPTFARNEQRMLGHLAAPAGLSAANRQDSLPSHQGAPMKMREVLLLSRDIAQGLAHLHAKVKEAHEPQPVDEDEEEEGEDLTQSLCRVIHRDLKPANILINSKGVAKISDFGLAREHRNSTGLETNNPHVGTLRYMAPELIASMASAKLTSKVDIYSLAILMWEMVARKVPWHEMNDLQVPLPVCSGKRPGTPGYTPPEVGSTDLDLTNFGPHTVAEMKISLNKASLSSLPPTESEPSFHTFPQFTTIIHACWQPNPRSRPSAATIYKQLQLLVEASGCDKPARF